MAAQRDPEDWGAVSPATGPPATGPSAGDSPGDDPPPHSVQQLPPAPPAPPAGAAPRAGDARALLEAADGMAPSELDRLPFGMIQLDAAGRILKLNAVESRLAALPQAQQIGKHFFTEVAPCTKVQNFYGRFKEGVMRESLDTSFNFHFAFKQSPRDVTVRLLYSRRTRSVWVMISDREGNPIG